MGEAHLEHGALEVGVATEGAEGSLGCELVAFLLALASGGGYLAAFYHYGVAELGASAAATVLAL